jgi:hypothetical protein
MSMIPCSPFISATNFWCLVLDIVHLFTGFSIRGWKLGFKGISENYYLLAGAENSWWVNSNINSRKGLGYRFVYIFQ